MLKKLFLITIVSASIAAVAGDKPAVASVLSRVVASVSSAVVASKNAVTAKTGAVSSAVRTFANNRTAQVSAAVASVRATKLSDVAQFAKNAPKAVVSKRGAQVAAVAAVVGAAIYFRNEIKAMLGFNKKAANK